MTILYRKNSAAYLRKMVAIKSLIVLDAETTSLPQLDHNTTKITELSLVGCEVDHLLQEKKLPRVLHKLLLVFNPMKKIEPSASSISGLTNELLMNLKTFSKEDVDVLRHFIDRLPPPVCLIAHNGDKFDFPILSRELHKVDKKLQDNVYCADSLKAFKELLPKMRQPKIGNRRGETTPTPTRTPSEPPILVTKKVCRQLFEEEDETRLQMAVRSVENRIGVNSHKLKDIHHHYFGTFIESAHMAESDSIALLKCIVKCDGFIDWVKENAIVFNSVEPLV